MATVKWEAGVVGWGGLRSRRPLSHGCYAQQSLDVARSHLCLVRIHTDGSLSFSLNLPEKGTPLVISGRI